MNEEATFFALRRQVQDIAASHRFGEYSHSLQTLLVAVVDLAVEDMGIRRAQAVIQDALERRSVPCQEMPPWFRALIEGAGGK